MVRQGVLMLVVGCASQGRLAFAAPTIYNLGGLSTNSFDIHSFGINESGQVVGKSANPRGYMRAYRYDGVPGTVGMMHDLGSMSGGISYAYGLNDLGQVTGSSATPTSSGSHHALLYSGTPGMGGSMMDLGTLGGRTSEGLSVNNTGQVAGTSDLPTEPSGFTPSRAFRYDGVPGVNGVMRDLGTLPGGVVSYGHGINSSGQVTGYSVGFQQHHAFRYDGTPGAGGVMHNLGTLGGTLSEGNAINDNGQVTGRSSVGEAGTHAFRYDGTPGQGGIMHDLGTLGGDSARGIAIDSAGNVVGWSRTATPFNNHAFLYVGTPGACGRMIDLDIWLDTENPDQGAKWFLDQPSGINDSGWITGSGRYDSGLGFREAVYLLDASSLIPEPVGLNAVLVVLLSLRRRSKDSRLMAGQPHHCASRFPPFR